jgi:hypothetical protein
MSPQFLTLTGSLFHNCGALKFVFQIRLDHSMHEETVLVVHENPNL